MRETSRELTRRSRRINHLYGARFHRTVITSPIYYLHAYKYVYRNPVKAGLCELVEEYRYSSLQGLLGETWLDIPVSEDDNWGTLETRENTLEWLNTSPTDEEWDQVRKALKKSEFKLTRIDNRPSALEDNAL